MGFNAGSHALLPVCDKVELLLFLQRVCSHTNLGLPVWLMQGDAMKIHSLANLGIPASCSLFQDVISYTGRGNGGGEGVSTDPSWWWSSQDASGWHWWDGSCRARCLALTPCQGLPVAGFVHSVFALFSVAEGFLDRCRSDCHTQSLLPCPF